MSLVVAARPRAVARPRAPGARAPARVVARDAPRRRDSLVRRADAAMDGASAEDDARRAFETDENDARVESSKRRFNAFTRTKEKDPYKRLGIDADATSEEVSSAFNFLIREHAGDERGVEAIEAAYDKVISERLSTRKMQKGLRRMKKEKNKDGVDYDAPLVQRVKAMFAKPDQQTLIRRTMLYVIISGWAIAAPATSGPAFQMACAFGTCVYFLNEKRGGQGTLGKAFRDSLIALLLAWLVGSIVPVYIPLFPQGVAPELILALFSFVAMWITCTFLK
jgi:hypothetical protein